MRSLLLLITLSTALSASAQIWDTAAHTSSSPFRQWVPQQQLDGFNLKQLQINKGGMIALTSWGLANLAYGSVATALTHGEAQAFHASNTIWGGVNLIIGLTGVFSSFQTQRATGLSYGQTILHQHAEEKLFLINGALDFAYIGAGAALWGFSDRIEKQSTRNVFSGGGKSFLMQGGFLLCFDWGMYIAHSQHAYRNLNRYTSGLAYTGEGISYTLAF